MHISLFNPKVFTMLNHCILLFIIIKVITNTRMLLHLKFFFLPFECVANWATNPFHVSTRRNLTIDNAICVIFHFFYCISVVNKSFFIIKYLFICYQHVYSWCTFFVFSLMLDKSVKIAKRDRVCGLNVHYIMNSFSSQN